MLQDNGNGGIFSPGGFHPIDAIARRFQDFGSNVRNHPFQTIARGVAGGLGGPLAGAGVGALENWWNNRQNDNFAHQVADRTQQQGDQAGQQAMNRPLNGALGQFTDSPQAPDNSALATALLNGRQGAPGPTNYGGQQALDSGGYNMAGNYGQHSGGFGQFLSGILPGNPGVPGLDTSGLDQLLGDRGGAVQTRSSGGDIGQGYQGVFSGQGANGENFIRGVQPGLGANQKYMVRRTPGN